MVYPFVLTTEVKKHATQLFLLDRESFFLLPFFIELQRRTFLVYTVGSKGKKV